MMVERAAALIQSTGPGTEAQASNALLLYLPIRLMRGWGWGSVYHAVVESSFMNIAFPSCEHSARPHFKGEKKLEDSPIV